MKSSQKISIAAIILTGTFIAYKILAYWQDDLYYQKAKTLNASQKYDQAKVLLAKALKNSPGQALYHLELARALTGLGQPNQSLTESQKALQLSPKNINLRKGIFTNFLILGRDDPSFYLKATQVFEETLPLAPKYAGVYYDLALAYVRIGQDQKAIELLKSAIELKANYKEARLAYSLLLIEQKSYKEAKAQLNYILEKIDPNDDLTKDTLNKLN